MTNKGMFVIEVVVSNIKNHVQHEYTKALHCASFLNYIPLLFVCPSRSPNASLIFKILLRSDCSSLTTSSSQTCSSRLNYALSSSESASRHCTLCILMSWCCTSLLFSTLCSMSCRVQQQPIRTFRWRSWSFLSTPQTLCANMVCISLCRIHTSMSFYITFSSHDRAFIWKIYMRICLHILWWLVFVYVYQ